MADPLPTILVPGLLCSARLYAPQLPALWPFGAVTVADHRRDDSVETVARRILDGAPQRFALAGLSYGGYIALAVVRAAPERVARLALLDTQARPDSEEAKLARRKLMSMAEDGKLNDVVDLLTPKFLSAAHQNDPRLRQIVRDMARDTGVDGFLNQQRAIMARPDSRPLLGSIRCPTLVLVGDSDTLTPPELSREMTDGIPGAKLAVIPDCGHLSTIEQPDAVNAALRDWLTR
jgi:pimeloyl-ACP methyl ester carboxylesterase